MNIQSIDKLVTSIAAYSARKKDMESLPASIDIFDDNRLIFCAEQIEKHLNEIIILPAPDKPKYNKPNKNKSNKK